MSYLSNHQVQDILEEIGMLNEDGTCPYTIEEIFRAGIKYERKSADLRTWRDIVRFVLNAWAGCPRAYNNRDIEKIAKKLQEEYGNMLFASYG